MMHHVNSGNSDFLEHLFDKVADRYDLDLLGDSEAFFVYETVPFRCPVENYLASSNKRIQKIERLMKNCSDEQNVASGLHCGSVMDCAVAMVAESFLHLMGYVRERWPIEFCNYLNSYFASLPAAC